MKITDNFYYSEAACKCGKCKLTPNLIPNITSHTYNLEVIRKALNDEIMIINSWVRCKKHNKKIGGVKNSQHLLGIATDIRSDNPKELAGVIELLIEQGLIDEGGIGIYDTFTHYDSRKTKARWDNRG